MSVVSGSVESDKGESRRDLVLRDLERLYPVRMREIGRPIEGLVTARGVFVHGEEDDAGSAPS